MKPKLINQTMNNRVKIDILAQEVRLHKLSVQTGKFKLSDAIRIGKGQMKKTESDPFLFNRIVSGLMNGSLTPEDFGKSRR